MSASPSSPIHWPKEPFILRGREVRLTDRAGAGVPRRIRAEKKKIRRDHHVPASPRHLGDLQIRSQTFAIIRRLLALLCRVVAAAVADTVCLHCVATHGGFCSADGLLFSPSLLLPARQNKPSFSGPRGEEEKPEGRSRSSPRSKRAGARGGREERDDDGGFIFLGDVELSSSSLLPSPFSVRCRVF